MVIIIGNNNASRKVKAWTAGEVNLDFVVENIDDVTVPGGSSESTVQDAVLDNLTAATIQHNKKIVITTPGFPSFESLDPSRVNVDAEGHCHYVSNGTAQVNIHNGRGTKFTEMSLTQTVGGTITTFNRHVPGSAGRAADTEIESRLSGKTPGPTTYNMWSVADHTNVIYTRNPNLWAADVDWSCCSPWNSNAGTKQAGCLVTPRHIITAHHYLIEVGSTIRFVSMNGTVCERTIAQRYTIPNTDLCIERLNADVDAGINFCKVLPTNALDYFPTMRTAQGYVDLRPVASCWPNQNDRLVVHDWISDYTGTAGEPVQDVYYQWFTDPETIHADRLAFYTAPISGDSGSPLGLILNDEFVLLSTWTTNAGGMSIRAYVSTINAAIVSMGNGGGYQLTTFDLTGFTNYG